MQPLHIVNKTNKVLVKPRCHQITGFGSAKMPQDRQSIESAIFL